MSKQDTRTPRAIEEYFPIVEINRLAVPERNSFKPIYQMHKWFARRASCVFRAILLGCLKPAGTDIMAEFYRDHTHDPDTNGKVILDPFMGGGTTVVEALRLGCHVIGIDLNPVAWFIVKTEVEPVDIDALKDAFERLANRTVEWSGKPLRETLLEQYKTACPCCGNAEADIMYTFWVKSAICTSPTCKREVPLYSDYIVAQKKPSIRYWRDVRCPKCSKTFDWEIEPAALIADASLMREDARTSAGEGRGNVRWAYSAGKTVGCPHCHEEVEALPAPAPGQKNKRERKKVPLTVLLCPHCEQVWQWRGELPEEVSCPACATNYQPSNGNLADVYDFVCQCGTRDKILDSLRRLPPEQRLRFKSYAIEGYCDKCSGNDNTKNETSTLFEQQVVQVSKQAAPQHECPLSKNNGKFIRRVAAADLARYQAACEQWAGESRNLPYPQQEVPFGYQTVKGNDLPGHGFIYWHQLFNPRQLLCLATMLKAIDEEGDQTLKEMLLSAFFQLVRNQCLLCFYDITRDHLVPALSRKDFAPPKTPLENSVWGSAYGRGTFSSIIDKIIVGKEFCLHPSDRKLVFQSSGTGNQPVLIDVPRDERIIGTTANVLLEAQSSTHLDALNLDNKLDVIVTDPPYAKNVNYSEVADFFYIWLRLLLADKYPSFAPEFAPKAEEINVQAARGHSMEDFERGLTEVFRKSGDLLKEEGLLVFTFHHEANSAWETVLESVMKAGFSVEAAYPIESEARKSGSMGAQKIAYDIIHVCKKRDPDAAITPRSWAGVRQEIRRRAREEIRAIEAGRYGQEPLPAADINVILIGKCLELYSRHYGAITEGEEKRVVELHEALKEIRNLVDALVTREHPLPPELEDLDAESRVYLLTLCGHKEIKSDDIHKTTRGVLEPDDLMAAGLMTKGRAKRGRTYEVKQPIERYRDLLEKFQVADNPQAGLFDDDLPPASPRQTIFIDYVHLLMGLAETGERLQPWLYRFRGMTPQLRAACEYLKGRNAGFAPVLEKISASIDPRPLFVE